MAAAGIAGAQQAVYVPRADGASTPLMVYQPARAPGCPPLALLSPGAGGDQNGLGYLAKALGADGWRAVVIGHRESGLAPLKRDIRNARGIHGGVAELVDDANAYRARFMDIDAARSWAQSQCRPPFTALFGHSMGARTVLMEAGARNKLGVQADGGFDAYVALSPAGPDVVFPPWAERDVRAPMLMITGTRDDGLDGDYKWRTLAFDALPANGCNRLAIVDGATHMNFAGIGFARKTKQAVVPLVTDWLDGLRAHQCAPAPHVNGVSITTK
jgi:dienelactone hydrolase